MATYTFYQVLAYIGVSFFPLWPIGFIFPF